MAHAKLILKIKGWQKAFVVRSLNLHQPFNGHHAFEIVVSIPSTFVLATAVLKDLLGEKAQIRIVTKEKEGTEEEKERSCDFTGFVDQINTAWSTSGRVLRIKGFSSTIFMDCAPRFRTFSNQSLSSILQKVIKDYDSGKLPKLNQKGTSDSVTFTVQNQETDYRFLCRLADNYGKIFFYDGKESFFGDLKNITSNKIELQLGKDCQHLELSQNLAPLNFQIKAYNLLNNKLESYNNDAKYGTVNEVVQATVEKSKTYPSAKIHVNYLTNKKEDLKQSAQRIIARQAHELVTLSGTSDNPELRIGSQLTIKGSDDLATVEDYIVLEVSHHVSSDDSYQNNFVAVPKGYPFSVRMQQGNRPMCGPLSAIVKSHKDPDKLGRIQVEFIGDTEQSLSPWLRVLVPFSKKNGFYFLPEKEDKVMVFFEDFNPEKSPFVLGSFYHGQSKPSKWQDANNLKKGIQTEKIAFIFDDKTGKLTIEAEEIELTAKKEMNLNGGQHLTQKATKIDLNP